jgi:hypothetical protein
MAKQFSITARIVVMLRNGMTIPQIVTTINAEPEKGPLVTEAEVREIQEREP